jgi:hypothetical protein
MNNSKIDTILLGLNQIIESNREKITHIYCFVKLFDPERITPSSLEEKTKEITTHCQKSTESRCLHGRSLGEGQTELSARILAGFALELYNCEFVDIRTGECIKDYESDLVQTKENDYFNMIINWYRMKVGGFTDDEISENLNDQYNIYISNTSVTNTQSKCVISG